MAATDVEFGPLMDVMRSVIQESINLDAAVAIARAHGARGEVTPQQLVAFSEVALNRVNDGDWRQALVVGEVAYAAAGAAHDARPDDAGFAEAWLAVGADVIEVLHAALFDAGDIRKYLRAREIADETIPVAHERNRPRIEGLLSLRFGTLVLDAYTASFTPTNYDDQFTMWVARAIRGGDPDLKFAMSVPAGPDGEPDQGQAAATWPSPVDALQTAERYLRDALPLIIPERRGRALKALVQALEWQGLLGGESDPDEIRRVGEQALQELDADDAQARLAVTGMLQRAGVTLTDEESVRLIEYDWPAFRAQTNERAAWDAVAQAAGVIGERDPRRALAIYMRQRELPGMWAHESERGHHFVFALGLFSKAYAPEGFDPFEGDLVAAARTAAALADDPASPAEARTAAAALIRVMLAATNHDREQIGLSVVDTLFALDQSLWADHVEAAVFLAANLVRGEGVNQMRAQDYRNAGEYYRQAADIYRQVGMADLVSECIGYLDDVVKTGSADLDDLTAWLASYSLEMELAAPASAPAAIQDLGAHVLAAQVSAGTSPLVIQLLLEVVKGRRFAAMLNAGTAGFKLEDSTRSLLDLEAAAEADLPDGSDVLRPMPFDAALGDDDLVTAWVDEFETGPSETPEDRVANLQRAVEKQVTASLIPAELSQVATLDDIQARLDDHTALLQLFEGSWTDGTQATWQVLATRNDFRIAVGSEQMPEALIRSSWQGRTVTMPASGFWVGALRRAVQEYASPLDVSSEGEKELTSAMSIYLRVLDDNPELLSGITRLIVVPHGASRYVPIHLAMRDGQTLADRYAVTYLSSLAQLTVDRRAGQRRSGVSVFALSYADQPELPALDDSAAEAEAIAAACGTTAQIDRDATEAAFAEALQTCRYVHLRAHGRLYVDAPSFHTVFLHPSDDADGRLRAYEVLQLDLTGLELVTLGACETALGRVDRSDNPRGLPAALLLAGARSVIGTLWPVLAGASTLFFTHLYRGLMASDGDITGSFVQAQQATRREFPEYRDWGAFYLVGDAGGAGAR